ncbi:MAG: S-layer homology domain-containing protein [Clostridiales bacterium]|nr:S-layer homology domain-containing protein [Clostridiales bacterium]
MRNLKKVISSVAALAIVASSASAFAVSFPDVDTSASYSGAVEALSGLGVINGDDNGLFNPDNQVTRAEFTKMAVEALGEGDAATSQTTSQFADAANTTVHWAAGYIAQGVSDGFINGYDDTTFGPDNQVTYAQACKMLVAAIGYTTYAENQGGWPSGYVAQASTLGITAGVSATNDTNLTRAQVATLIYNAMDVPLCVIDSWENNVNYATGEIISTPVLKKLDGKENRDYQTLLTDRHDAYKVKGRVTQNSIGTGLDKDEVTYQAEVADNLYDEQINFKVSSADKADRRDVKVGTTNAANMLFEYTEALIQVDEDSDNYTILAITQYGNSKIVEVKADDVADDDSTIGTDYVGKGKLPVYKSQSSSSTTKYDLDANAELYVNGVRVNKLDNDNIRQYILDNATGTVKLVDVTNPGSTSTDGKYDYVMVSFYVDAIVDSIQTTSSYAKIYFKNASNGMKQSMKWDPEDEEIDIKFTDVDGNAVAYTDLEEYDVLSIAYNVTATDSSLDDLDYYDVIVSKNQVVGTLTSRDTDDYTIRVDGTDYDVVEDLVGIGGMELSTEYTLYIDAFGYVAHYDEGNSDKNYGVIVAMYKSAGNDYPTVRMITSNAEVVAYECKDSAEADKFYNYATGTDAGYQGDFTKSTQAVRARILEGKTVCTYKLSSGKVKFDKPMSGQGGANLEYKASSSKLQSWTISDASTKIIDMDDYMKPTNSGSTVKTLSVSSFEDEATYTAYLFDKNSAGDYRFAIVLAGTSSIRPETQIAVVTKVVGTTTYADQDNLTELKVAKGGQEDISVYLDGTAAEGDVIAYTTNADGYVDSSDLYTLISAGSSYDTMLANTIAKTNFGGMINSSVVTPVVDKGDKFAITYTDDQKTNVANRSKDVYAYFGTVYKKQNNNLEVITAQADNKSDIANVESFTVANVNSYIYDFGQKAKYRVSVGAQNQSDSIFNQSYYDEDKNIIAWNKVQANDVNPTLVFVKEVDGDVTDVVYFVAP